MLVPVFSSMRVACRLVFGGAVLAQIGRSTSPAIDEPELPWDPEPEVFSVHVPVHGQPVPASPGQGSLESLYPARGSVLVSSGESLQARLADEAEGGRKWYFIEMYDQHCPHCWYTVPVITRVARGFAGVNLLRVSAINCHERSNKMLCITLGVLTEDDAYPNFVLCPPHLDFPRPHWPPKDSEYSLLPESARDLLPQIPKDMIRLMFDINRCHIHYNNSSVLSKAAGVESPFSAQILADWITKETRIAPSHPEAWEDEIQSAGKAPVDPTGPPGIGGWVSEESGPGIPLWMPGDRWEDATLAFLSLLFHEFAGSKHEDVVAAAEFFAQACPAYQREMTEMASDLKDLGNSVHIPSEMQSFFQGWAKKLKYPDLSKDHYLSCKTGTCAFWTLLHTVVGSIAARGMSHASLFTDAHPYVTTTPIKAVEWVRSMVSLFLSCRQCKIDFLADLDNCAYGACYLEDDDWHGLLLWLWRAHNAVSLRVAGEQKALVDRRWPMYRDCPRCWKPSLIEQSSYNTSSAKKFSDRLATSGTTLSVAQLDSPFNLDHIFWFVLDTYVGLDVMEFSDSDLSQDELKAYKMAVAAWQSKKSRRTPSTTVSSDSAGFVLVPDRPSGRNPHDRVKVVAHSLVGIALLSAIAGYCCLKQHYLTSYARFCEQQRLCVDRREVLPEDLVEDPGGADSGDEVEAPAE